MSSDTAEMSYPEAISKLRKDLAEHPDSHPEVADKVFWLPLTEISSMVAVFQPRALDGNQALSDDHIETLAKAVTSKTTKTHQFKMLPPLDIWWCGTRWIVLDGHHRRQAYFLAAKEIGIRPRDMKVAVKVFRGNLGEAIAVATRGNSRDKLPMSREDKMNAAWRLVLSGDLSLAQIAEAASVSTRQASIMRKALKTLLENPESIPDIGFEDVPETDREVALKDALGEAGWHKSQIWSRGEELPEDFDVDQARHRKAKQIAKSWSKRHGRKLIDDPEVGALALWYYDRRSPGAYMRTDAWADEFAQARDQMEEDEELCAEFTPEHASDDDDDY